MSKAGESFHTTVYPTREIAMILRTRETNYLWYTKKLYYNYKLVLRTLQLTAFSLVELVQKIRPKAKN